MALTPRQYRSHIDRNRGWPPRSQLELVSLEVHMVHRIDIPSQLYVSFVDPLHVKTYGWYRAEIIVSMRVQRLDGFAYSIVNSDPWSLSAMTPEGEVHSIDLPLKPSVETSFRHSANPISSHPSQWTRRGSVANHRIF